MHWGMRWGDPWGTVVSDLRSISLPTPPPSALVSWDAKPTTRPVVFQVYVNGRFHAATRNTQMVVVLDEPGRFFFEVFAVGESNEAQDLSSFLDLIPGERIRLAWTPHSTWGRFLWGIRRWGANEASLYRIYWDKGLGGPLELLAETGQNTYTTERLEDGTYKFRVDALDAAGNQLTSGLVMTFALSRMPTPPADLKITSFASGTFSATWTPSPSTDVTAYHLYSNHGSGPVDYSSPVAVMPAPASAGSWSESGTAGAWIHALRAVDATYEENNVHVRHAYELDGSPLAVLGAQPATPIHLTVTAIEGGKIRLVCEYPAMVEESLGTEVRFYYDSGTGTISYASPLLTVSLGLHELRQPVVLTASADTSALSDGTTYKFAARAATAGGRESASSNEASATADALAPPDIAALTAEATL